MFSKEFLVVGQLEPYTHTDTIYASVDEYTLVSITTDNATSKP